MPGWRADDGPVGAGWLCASAHCGAMPEFGQCLQRLGCVLNLAALETELREILWRDGGQAVQQQLVDASYVVGLGALSASQMARWLTRLDNSSALSLRSL